MEKVELKIAIKDWLYIIIIGAFFGFFISLFFYFLNKELQNSSTIIFKNVNVIPMNTEIVLEGFNVIVKDGKITELGSSILYFTLLTII